MGFSKDFRDIKIRTIHKKKENHQYQRDHKAHSLCEGPRVRGSLPAREPGAQREARGRRQGATPRRLGRSSAPASRAAWISGKHQKRKLWDGGEKKK